MSDLASKEDFFDCCGEHKKEPFTLPSGKVVFVEEITAFEHERFQQELAKYRRDKGDDNLWDPEAKARLIVRCVTRGDSKPFFDKPEDVHAVAKMPVRLVEPLFRLCQQVNGLDRDSAADLKKNSGEDSDS